MRSVLSFNCKDWCWCWNSNTLATWCEELTLWKRLRCWERLKVREGDDRGWDGWMASPTLWTWVWVSSRNWWWIGRPGVLLSMGSQRVGHNCATELNWNSHALNNIQAKVSLLLEKKIHANVNYIEMPITLQFKKWQQKNEWLKRKKFKKMHTQVPC